MTSSRGARWRAAIVVLCLLTAACSDSTNRVIEPRPDFKYDASCTVAWGIARLGQLFYAVNQQDVAAVERLFPGQGAWEFEIAPSIARSLAAGHPLSDAEADRSTTPGGIPGVVYGLAGLHLVFTTSPSGSAGPMAHTSPSGTETTNEVDLGPILWEAFGPALEARGKSRLRGGGKVALSCDSGRFLKVTLGLQAID